MDLKTYLHTLDDDQCKAFAKRCDGASPGHLWNCAYGTRSPSASLAVAIERESGRGVTRQELFPEKYRAIWPELAVPNRPEPEAA